MTVWGVGRMKAPSLSVCLFVFHCQLCGFYRQMLGALCVLTPYMQSQCFVAILDCVYRLQDERESHNFIMFAVVFLVFLNHTFPRYLEPGSHWSVLAVRFANNKGQSLSGPLAAHLWAVI